MRPLGNTPGGIRAVAFTQGRGRPCVFTLEATDDDGYSR